MMGLTYELFPMQPAWCASMGAGESFHHHLFPQVPAEMGFASQAVASQREDMGGDTRPPPAAAVLAMLLPPPLSLQVLQPTPFKTCSLSCLSGPFSPCCGKQLETDCEQQTSACTSPGTPPAGPQQLAGCFGFLLCDTLSLSKAWQPPPGAPLSQGTSQWVLPAILHLYMDFAGG